MMTPFSHGFNMHIISVYQMRGELQERTLSCCNAPQEKGQPRHGSLAALVQGTEQASHRATLPLPGWQQCLKASTEVSQNQTKALFIKLHNLQVSPALFWEQHGCENFSIFF